MMVYLARISLLKKTKPNEEQLYFARVFISRICTFPRGGGNFRGGTQGWKISGGMNLELYTALDATPPQSCHPLRAFRQGKRTFSPKYLNKKIDSELSMKAAATNGTIHLLTFKFKKVTLKFKKSNSI